MQNMNEGIFFLVSGAETRRMNIIQIGALIKSTRIELGYSQQEIAEAAKVTQTVLSRIEKGSYKFSEEKYTNLADVLSLEFELDVPQKNKRKKLKPLPRKTKGRLKYNRKGESKPEPPISTIEDSEEEEAKDSLSQDLPKEALT